MGQSALSRLRLSSPWLHDWLVLSVKGQASVVQMLMALLKRRKQCSRSRGVWLQPAGLGETAGPWLDCAATYPPFSVFVPSSLLPKSDDSGMVGGWNLCANVGLQTPRPLCRSPVALSSNKKIRCESDLDDEQLNTNINISLSS